MSKKVFVFLADGFEEVEAITPIDYLRRAGADLTTVSIGTEKLVVGSHTIPVLADALITEIDGAGADCIVLPGGMPGSNNLAFSPLLDKIIRQMDQDGRLICAICAAPAVVLGSKGMLSGRSWTCYPGSEISVRCDSDGCSNWVSDTVVVDGNIITSRAAGTAGIFAKKIIEKLFDKTIADKIAAAVLLDT